MLAEQFTAAAAAARNTAAVDEIARLLWRAHAEVRVTDAEAGAVSEAIEARRAALAGKGPTEPSRPPLGRPKAVMEPERREKMFGIGRPRALDRNAKVRIMHWARCLARKTEKGKAYGQVTAKALAVLEALLWGFHNGKSGICFPLCAVGDHRLGSLVILDVQLDENPIAGRVGENRDRLLIAFERCFPRAACRFGLSLELVSVDYELSIKVLRCWIDRLARHHDRFEPGLLPLRVEADRREDRWSAAREHLSG